MIIGLKINFKFQLVKRLLKSKMFCIIYNLTWTHLEIYDVTLPTS